MKPLSTGTGLKDRLKQFDICLLICTSVLSILSLLLMYSIADKEDVGFGLLKMQAAATFAGVCVMVFLSMVDYQEVVNKLWLIFLIGEIGLLGITLIYGVAEGENVSWLKIGPIHIQPSEFVKGTFGGSLPAFVAAFTSRNKLSEKETLELVKLIMESRK